MKRVILLILIACLTIASSHGAEAARKKAAAKRKPTPDKTAAIVVDAATGTVIYEKNATAQRYPASLTKMMTLYLTFEKIQTGQLRKTDRLNVSSRAAGQAPSKLGLRPGSTLKVEDAILALVTKSANDASVVLAEGIAGSESAFANMMTQKARQLGMLNTRFVNANGLPNPAQITTARDMAILSLALLRDFPRDYRYFRTQSFTYAGVVNKNHNHLMSSYQGMDGIKTGYVYASGYNLAASAVRGNHRLVGVVFGGTTASQRNNTMAKILDDGFEFMERGGVKPAAIAAAPQAAPAKAPAPVETAWQDNDRPTAGAVETGDDEDDDAAAVAAAPAAQPVQTVTTGRQTNVAVTSKATGKLVASKKTTTVTTTKKPAVEQGDTADEAPKSLAAAGMSGWAVQIGAFASHDASMVALRNAQKNLPPKTVARGQPVVVPLMTNRGLIYRARIHNLDKNQAVDTCRVLKEHCLILAVD